MYVVHEQPPVSQEEIDSDEEWYCAECIKSGAAAVHVAKIKDDDNEDDNDDDGDNEDDDDDDDEAHDADWTKRGVTDKSRSASGAASASASGGGTAGASGAAAAGASQAPPDSAEAAAIKKRLEDLAQRESFGGASGSGKSARVKSGASKAQLKGMIASLGKRGRGRGRGRGGPSLARRGGGRW